MARTKPYTIPFVGRQIQVDAELDVTVLNRLNALPNVDIVETCAGHHRGGERYAKVVFKAEPRARRGVLANPPYHDLLVFAPYLERLSATEYRARPSHYRSNGGQATWYLEIRCEHPGPAPRRWWHGLVNLLEENPDCTQWLP